MLKIIVIIMIIAIIISLGSALFAMVGGGKRSDNSKKMFKSLVWRVSLSVLLFVILIISYYLGLIQPVNSLNNF